MTTPDRETESCAFSPAEPYKAAVMALRDWAGKYEEQQKPTEATTTRIIQTRGPRALWPSPAGLWAGSVPASDAGAGEPSL